MVNGQKQLSIILPRIEEERQLLSALRMVGSGFEAQGGASLMLTEAVENSVDAVIDARKRGCPKTGQINLIVEMQNAANGKVIVKDDGTGFLEVKKALEKPYKSVKADDPDQTGKWGRGLQGFRSFCKMLTIITKRKSMPTEENFLKEKGADGRTLKLSFDADSSPIDVIAVKNIEFEKYCKSEHGTVVIYENWHKGQFEKLNESEVIRRLEHHFGEEIRKGSICIKAKILGKETECKPHDYSTYQKINIPSIKYSKGGEIKFNLYLSDRGRKDRWEFPYLLYEDRPVGNGFIVDVDEFRDNPIWESQFLTGYMTCDFCRINETRTALKPGDELDFLFKNIKKIELILEKAIKQHTKGIYELKLQKQITELVVNLQKFLKNKHIFDFKIAKSTGLLSEEEKDIEVVEIVANAGADISKEIQDSESTATATTDAVQVTKAIVKENPDGTDFTKQTDSGGHGDGSSTSTDGGPDKPAEENQSGTDGYKGDDRGVTKPLGNNVPLAPGGEGTSNRKARRPRPRGFNIAQQDEELNPEPSWFDGVNSVIVINSGHERFNARANNKSTRNKELLDYLAELYLWEISKLVKKDASAYQLGSFFLNLKFEYFEKQEEEKPKETAENSVAP